MSDFNKNWEKGDPIGYVRKEIPSFENPEYKGQRYEAMVPDTFDIQEMAELAINCMTESTDPLADYEMYIGTIFSNNPIYMKHEYNDMCQMKYHEALPLCRMVSGSLLNMDVERKRMEVILKEIGPDGNIYLPVKGRPWATSDFWEAGEAFANKFSNSEQMLCPVYAGRNIAAMTIYYLRSGDEIWKAATNNLIDALGRIAVDRGSFAYYSPSVMIYAEGSTEDIGVEKPVMGAEVREIYPALVRWYKITGYKPAITLAKKLIKYVIEELKYYGEDGSYKFEGHFHQHTAVLLGVLEYIMATGDTEYLELVKKGYEYGKANGDTVIGFFPEFLNSKNYENSELCEVADMIALAFKLTEYGVGDYWDDADRWIRNMFVEGQLTKDKAKWLERYSKKFDNSKDIYGKKDNPDYVSEDNVVDRNIGGFASWPRPNEWWAEDHPYGIMHCCTGNSSRAIYYIWENIVNFKDGELKVNLLMNHASKWADVDSHIPYTGRVDVRIKQDMQVSIRIPEWVSQDEAEVLVDGKKVEASWDGRYAKAGAVKAGSVLTLLCPIFEKWEGLLIEKHTYNVLRRGNDVVMIDPPGKICPLFNREYLTRNVTRWKKVKRFVSDEEIYW
jgi:hypothetical protein